MTIERSLRARRAVAVVATLVVPAVLVVGAGHRGAHMARNIVFPGAGLIDERPLIALCFMVVAVSATVAWVKWGVDWSVAAVIVLSTAAAGALASTGGHAAGPATRSAHEFPLVIVVVGGITWLRSVAGRMPGLRSVSRRRSSRVHGLADVHRLAVVDRCRSVAIAALAESDGPDRPDRLVSEIAAVESVDVVRRAQRIGLFARGRRGGDPFSIDHAHARAALSLTGRLSAASTDRFIADGCRAPAGVPASEPGWVRPLDGTLAAVALHRAGDTRAAQRWTSVLRGSMSLRRGHRPAFWWTPLGVSAGSSPPWEHAASTGIARAMGWLGDDDWKALRSRVLGAAARGIGSRDDERLIAAGRVWLAFVDDRQASAIVARPTVQHDPLAVALDRLARRLHADPCALIAPTLVSEGNSAA